MSLKDLWKSSPQELDGKHIRQLIAIAGQGSLLDDSDCSTEFRAFLATVPPSSLSTYAEQCLADSFTDSGLALQDVVNEIGSRLGASVIAGRYRGTKNHVGLDGLWRFPSSHSIVIEVKTTDAYRIDMGVIAGYRRSLISTGEISEHASSVLLIVGRQDTGDLEAQIRGSRHAWDIRIISVDAILRLMKIKLSVEDPDNVSRIHNILIPREFTRLDEIADVLFSAAEDIQQDQEDEPREDLRRNEKGDASNTSPVAFHEACVLRVQAKLGVTFVKRSRVGYSTPDGKTGLNCTVSKEHDAESQPNYWFAFHPHQAAFLHQCSNAYVAFGCGSSDRVLLIPFNDFEPWLDGMWTTTRDGGMYWHVVIYREEKSFTLRRKNGAHIDLSKYVLVMP